MPTLRSKTAASTLGNAKRSSDIPEQGDATIEVATAFSNPSPSRLGPGTPAQDHEAARAGEPNSAPIIRRSRRLSAMAAVDFTHVEVGLPRRKGRRREALASCADEGDASLPVEEFNKGKRKAEEEAFLEFSCEKNNFAGLDSQVLDNSDFSSKASPAFGKGRGRGSRGLEAMMGDGVPDHQPKQPLAFDLNQSLHGSSSSDELGHMPNTERLLAERQVSVHLDFDSFADDSDATILAKDETAVHPVVEDTDDNMSADLEAGPSHRPQAEVGRRRRGRGRGMRGGAEASRSRFLQIARERAFHFAHFNAEGDEAPAGAPPPRADNGRRRGRQPRQLNQNRPQPRPQAQQVDWPGPFSTARQLVNNRAEAAAARQNAGAPGSKVSLVDWHPSRVHGGECAFTPRKCPSLQDLCLSVLANNAENLVSLEGVPELFRFRISNAFCERRKMSAKLLSLFFQGEPSELHSLDCTQIPEDELTEMMKQISPSRLERMHLHNCGRALSEQCLVATIASPSTVTLLKSISLTGAYRLSDGGLEALLQASPQLVHLDLSTCSFLTNASIKAIACCVGGTLESLVLDGCTNLNAAAFVHDLVRLQKLQKISLAEVSGVTDEVVTEICVQLGLHLREIVLARCNTLTDAAIAAIGPCCPSLQRLDLAHLSLLTDVAIAHITDNLSKIQVLNVRRCKFSDEAIAAFVTASGMALRNLSLNSVHQVADQTILALARHSNACLECLDLSFCRLVDDECLGLLADACLQLQELKLYGCTQVTDKFLNGHSNLKLKVVGLRNSV